MTDKPETKRSKSRPLRTAATCAGVIALMLGMSFAAVPLYDLFCRVTGFGGTPQVATQEALEQLKNKASDRKMIIRFDSNVSPALNWSFSAKSKKIEANVGEPYTVNYRVQNLSQNASKGTATYNVVPEGAGQYFIKMQCFCFTEQTLKGAETQDMPVVFYIDPEIDEDETLKNVDTITLSYTFFPLQEQATQQAE